MNEPDPSPFIELMDAVVAVAAAPPLNHSPNTFAAQVPWNRIERLRRALDATGFEWRS